jgi:cytosine/uracil/thiamine/allantoin permease
LETKLIVLVVAIVPNVPGFVAVVYAGNSAPEWLIGFYDYAWFISLGLSFLLYGALNKFWKNAPVIHRNERENEETVPLEELEPQEINKDSS